MMNAFGMLGIILLFVAIDGWGLLSRGLVLGYR